MGNIRECHCGWLAGCHCLGSILRLLASALKNDNTRAHSYCKLFGYFEDMLSLCMTRRLNSLNVNLE